MNDSDTSKKYQQYASDCGRMLAAARCWLERHPEARLALRPVMLGGVIR